MEGNVFTEEPDVLVELGVVEWRPRGDVVGGVDRAMVDVPGDGAWWGGAVVVVAEREERQLGGGIEELELAVGHTHRADDTAKGEMASERQRRGEKRCTHLTEMVGTLMFCMRTSK